jgi:ABC-type dipeptide/oligopeptide/nickel transport system permease component/ABC-type transport system substrate-binding protein
MLLGLCLGFAGRLNAAEPGHITLGVQLEPPGLDPTIGAASAIREVSFSTIFEALIRLGPRGEHRPWLAESWTISDDGLVYQFQLRNGVRFHDGAPFDAASAKFSLDRARAADSKNAQRQAFGVIDKVTILDPGRIEVVLKRRFSDLLNLLSYGDAAMVSPQTAATNVTRPIGTGPYQFAEWRRGTSVRVIRQDNYWGRAAILGSITFTFIGDPTAARAALEAGDVDGFPGFPAPELVARLSQDPRFQVYAGLSSGKTIMAMNNRRAPFTDPRIRQAISRAIDREALIKAAMFGYGAPIGSHFGTLDDGYVDLTAVNRFDPDASRVLLAQAKFQMSRPLKLILPPLSYARRAGEIMAEQLAAVGVKVIIENVEWAVWLDQVFTRHDYDLTIVAHVEPMDYDIYARDSYYFGYDSARYRAAYADLQAITAPDARRAGLARLQEILAEDAPCVFLFQLPALGVFRADIHDIWAPTLLTALDLTTARIDRAGDSTKAKDDLSADSQRGPWAPIILGAAIVAALALMIARLGLGPIMRRLSVLVATLFIASLLIFAAAQIAPGDPARHMLGMGADQSAVDALRGELGLDQPMIQRYGTWISGMMQGDLGTSYAYRVPVTDLVVERLGVTVPLTILALLLSTLMALGLGLSAAIKPQSIWDRAISVVTQIGVAVPNFWAGMVLVLIFAVGFRLLPAGGFPGWQAGYGAVLTALILPAIALALPQSALLTRVLRSELVHLATRDFIRTAFAKGLSRRQVMMAHALPNALVPMVTLIGLQFSYLLAGAVLIETVFSLPGLGRLVFQAVGQRDLPLLQSVALVLVGAVILVSFVVDLVASLIDPRLRQAEAP